MELRIGGPCMARGTTCSGNIIVVADPERVQAVRSNPLPVLCF